MISDIDHTVRFTLSPRVIASLCLALMFLSCQSDRAETDESETRPIIEAEPSDSVGAVRRSDEVPDTTISDNEGEPTEDFKGSIGALQGGGNGGQIATLSDVRSATHEDFDRIVFEFNERLPAWETEYVDQPVHECGSGRQRFIRGDGYLRARFRGAAAHTEEGRPTIQLRDRELLEGNLRHLTLVCDFEGEVVWVIGLASPNRYRVQEFTSPPRLVIDVRQ